jgi:hypothetical protein
MMRTNLHVSGNQYVSSLTGFEANEGTDCFEWMQIGPRGPQLLGSVYPFDAINNFDSAVSFRYKLAFCAGSETGSLRCTWNGVLTPSFSAKPST